MRLELGPRLDVELRSLRPKRRGIPLTSEGAEDRKYSAERIKHLEMVQGVVARLGGNGFVVKGWAIPVAGAFYGFSIKRQNGWLALAALAPTCLFWLFDSTYLRSERALFGLRSAHL